MKFLSFGLLTAILFSAGCISKNSTRHPIVTTDSNLNSENQITNALSRYEIESVCKRLANFRDQLDGIMDTRVSDEVLLKNEVGGYGYIDLLYIVRRYGQEIGSDTTYEKCVKYLCIFNDGEYSGVIDRILPYSTKFKGHSQEWLINS